MPARAQPVNSGAPGGERPQERYPAHRITPEAVEQAPWAARINNSSLEPENTELTEKTVNPIFNLRQANEQRNIRVHGGLHGAMVSLSLAPAYI